METIGQIVGFIFAAFFLLLAYKLYNNNKNAAGGLVAVIGALILLCSFPWFQGWAKSFIASNIISKLTAIGQQVNTVQETTTAMHTQLDKHQKELDVIQAKIREAESNVFSQQIDITNQYHQISMVQSDLATAQTNFAAQEKELADVEYWVKNLYAKMTNEAFLLTDTNHVLIANSSNGRQQLFIRLSQVPINGSVEANIQSANIEQLKYPQPKGFIKNIMKFDIYNYDVNSTSISFHYVADTRETNYYRQMPKLNEEIQLLPNDMWIVKPLP